MRPGIVLLTLFWLSHLNAAEIVVIYPRADAEGRPHVYDDALDSTFIFGHVAPPSGRLEINGQGVLFDTAGAFLAFLPLRKPPETSAWNLSLTNGGDSVRLNVAYDLRSMLPPPPDTLSCSFPCIVEVNAPNAHIRTVRGGSYQSFPLLETRFLAESYTDSFFDIHLSNGLYGVIERKFVTAIADSILPSAAIGDGECTIEKDYSVCRFALSRKIAWTVEYRPDQRALELFLFDTQLKIDRVRYLDSDDVLKDIQWEQASEGVRLRILLNEKVRGYDMSIANDKLVIAIRHSKPKNAHSLRNKIVALDAGHGGGAAGSVGPMGTQEKDITLKWSLILQDELERRGAIVVQTRTHDANLDLYERIRIANETNADFLLSLHANALPDNVNPFTRRGAGTYYYNTQSRDAADLIQRHVIHDTGLADDGIFDANLALARPTAFPAVLIEAAYLMHPEEERLLNSDIFLKKLSRAVASALQEYFRTEY